MQHTITVKQLEEVLPQTQCGLCSYDGCQPYAEAIVHQDEKINRCPPGGVRGLLKLAELTGQDAAPYLNELREKEKPRMLARIREDECIGCTKCISACPTDAILGASKHMHTIIEADCSGCELCIAPCPVDCIDMITLGKVEDIDEISAYKKAAHYRDLYENRQIRLKRNEEELHKKHQRAKLAHKKISGQRDSLATRKQAIEDAVNRAQARKPKMND